MVMRSGTANNRVIAGVVVGCALVVAVIAVVRLDTTGDSGSGLGPEYLYDINELAKVDPGLIIYEESAGPLNTGFEAARAIAVDSEGSIHVAGDKAVRIFKADGAYLDLVELAAEPRSLAVSGDRTIYVGFKDHVELYDRDKHQLAVWDSLGHKAVISSIAVAGDDVFVADAGNRMVIRYDRAGKVVNHIAKRDPARNVPGLVIPSPYCDVAVSKDGLLRVVNPGRHRIEAYTFDGDLEFWWGEHSTGIRGFCGCCNPVNFAVLGNGHFVTCEKGLVRVKQYDSDGGFVGVVASPAQLVSQVEFRICNTPQECQSPGFDVAVDARGRVLVLDTVKGVVRIFSRKGSGQ
ncbi:MAG: hypothetical protein JSU94_03480 [Phycisphaerales bacterium]|nr:MAG: hypothetical protein JSU94_03480 [Phycisphaerales bacterium]